MPGPSWPGLSAAVGLISARQAGIRTTATDLTPHVPADEIINCLALIAAAFLDSATIDRGTDFLRTLGLAAQDNA